MLAKSGAEPGMVGNYQSPDFKKSKARLLTLLLISSTSVQGNLTISVPSQLMATARNFAQVVNMTYASTSSSVDLGCSAGVSELLLESCLAQCQLSEIPRAC